MLFKSIFRHWNCFLLSVAVDGKDGNGFKLENVGLNFSSLNAMRAKPTKKLTVFSARSLMKFLWYLLHNSTGALCVWVKASRNDSSSISTYKFSKLISIHFFKELVKRILIKDQSIFPEVIILLNLITSSFDDIPILRGENSCWSTKLYGNIKASS